MAKNIAILIAVVGVCMFIGATYLSNSAWVEEEPAGNTIELAMADDTSSKPASPLLDVEAFKTKATTNPIKPTVPEGAVDISPVIYGNTNAPVIIEEFASFTCSHCASFYRDQLPQVKQQLLNNGLAQLRVYSFVRNPADLEATMIVQCQGDAEARKRFTGAILNAQEQWAGETYQEGLKAIARVGGMSDEDYTACVENQALIDKVVSSRQWFDKQVGVEATPYFRIGDEVIKGSRTAEVFANTIRKIYMAPAAETKTEAPAEKAAE